MTNLWRINISPASEPGVDAREFCFARGILGFGWPVNVGRTPLTWQEYEERATSLYYDSGDRGWWPAANAIHNRMKIGDLIWSRDWSAVYYLGKVIGEWQYSESAAHLRADVVNYRSCEWLKVGLADEVPGAVRNSFSRARVLQCVCSDAALTYSAKLFDDSRGTSEYAYLYRDRPSDLFGLLSHSALEDLVGLYLQSLGYSIVPSTCHRTSAAYEFVLRHRTGGYKAVVQVKVNESLNRDDYVEMAENVYLFTASELYRGHEAKNVHCITRKALEEYAERNRERLPAPIARWL